MPKAGVSGRDYFFIHAWGACFRPRSTYIKIILLNTRAHPTLYKHICVNIRWIDLSRHAQFEAIYTMHCLIVCCRHTLIYIMYLTVCVHSDGLAQDLGNSGADWFCRGLLSRHWLYASVCGCVCVWSTCVWVFYLLLGRTIAHRANVICCTSPRL